MKMSIPDWWVKNRWIERSVFLILVVANATPLFFTRYFPFMDAPAHLYNSGVLWHLLSGDCSFYKEYFAFNSVLVPNWISYLIMSPLHLFLNPWMTEKYFLLIYFVGFPFAMRYCISCMVPGRGYMAYLAFPLSYNMLTLFSFYNFSMALIFFLLCIGYFYKHIVWGKALFRHYLTLSLLVFLTFLSHPVVLCITFLILLLIYVHEQYITHGVSILKWFNGKTLRIIIAVLPSVFFMILYLRAPTTGQPSYQFLNTSDLFQRVLDGTIFIAYSQDEALAAKAISMSICCAFFIGLFLLIFSFSRYGIRSKTFFLFPSVLIILLLYWFMPDSDGMGGFISMRLCIILFICCILFFASFNLYKPFLAALLVFVLVCQAYRLNLYTDIIKSRAPEVAAITQEAHFIEPESFLYTYQVDDDWLGGHYHNYLCMEQKCIPLQDYECQTAYFPLVWRNYGQMNDLIDNVRSFGNLEKIKKEIRNHPLYYWILGDLSVKTEPAYVELRHNLAEHCILVHRTDYGSLYKLN